MECQHAGRQQWLAADPSSRYSVIFIDIKYSAFVRYLPIVLSNCTIASAGLKSARNRRR